MALRADDLQRKGKGWASGAKFAQRAECQYCGFLFYAEPARVKRGAGKFCSYKCRGLASISIEVLRTCRCCDATIISPRSSVQKVCDSCTSLAKVRAASRPSRMKSACSHCRLAIVGRRKYCNRTCYDAFRAERKRPRMLTPNSVCKACSNAFYASPKHKAAGWGNYCSTKCKPLPSHGNAKGGMRDDLGIYVRSSWEANYARYLKWLLAHGQIKAWEYEPETFYFETIKRGTRSYCPDFRVTENSGKRIFHEVKGYLDAKSKTKLARMKKFYPAETVILIQQKEMRDIRQKMSALIPNWEIGSNDKLGRNKVLQARGWNI